MKNSFCSSTALAVRGAAHGRNFLS